MGTQGIRQSYLRPMRDPNEHSLGNPSHISHIHQPFVSPSTATPSIPTDQQESSLHLNDPQTQEAHAIPT
ncbi:hypothetical protein B0T14DRAFT_518594 [Immersiella caudata]|uniref:Uncharacterized protein n=1 Tax=Immersiella caudata TaxID=314043 RepID=A0AA40BZG6_9PEZI|nr:hypothetical protein B0T14DRAFT_518594 [Immersiella caudata]